MRSAVPLTLVAWLVPALAVAQPPGPSPQPQPPPQEQSPLNRWGPVPQEQPAPQPAPQPPAPEVQTPSEAPPPPAPPQPAAPPGPPPVIVAVVPHEHVPEEAQSAVLEAIGSRLGGLVRRRPVRAMSPPQLTALAACPAEDAACIGQQIGADGAILGIVARFDRRNARRPATLTLQALDPFSGNPRTEPQTVTLEAEQLAAPAELVSPLVAALEPILPPPPRRTTLLVAVNVDGAQVTVDDQPIGETPLAPLELPPGEHVVMVNASGFNVQRRDVTVEAGASARLDVDLAPDAETQRRDEMGEEAYAELTAPGGDESIVEQWWFWTAIGGGVVLVAATIGIIAAVAGGDDEPAGIPIPPIQ